MWLVSQNGYRQFDCLGLPEKRTISRLRILAADIEALT
jgi:hypothetical protein